MTFTKKLIKEYLANCISDKEKEFKNIWKEMQKRNLAGEYCSQERIKNFWNYFSFVISDDFFDNFNMDWEYFHSV